MPGRSSGDRRPPGSLAPYLSTLATSIQIPEPGQPRGEELRSVYIVKCWLNNPTAFLFAGGFRSRCRTGRAQSWRYCSSSLRANTHKHTHTHKSCIRCERLGVRLASVPFSCPRFLRVRADQHKTGLGVQPREIGVLPESARGCHSMRGLAVSLPHSPRLRAQELGRRLTHCRLMQWLLEKGQMNAEATIKASSSEAMLQLSGNNLDSYSCHHLARASFLISFGSSQCHSTKGELALPSTLCLT